MTCSAVNFELYDEAILDISPSGNFSSQTSRRVQQTLPWRAQVLNHIPSGILNRFHKIDTRKCQFCDCARFAARRFFYNLTKMYLR